MEKLNIRTPYSYTHTFQTKLVLPSDRMKGNLKKIGAPPKTTTTTKQNKNKNTTNNKTTPQQTRTYHNKQKPARLTFQKPHKHEVVVHCGCHHLSYLLVLEFNEGKAFRTSRLQQQSVSLSSLSWLYWIWSLSSIDQAINNVTNLCSFVGKLVCGCVCVWVKLQALVYDTLPSTTAVFSYATGSWQLSANEQFFIGAQKVVSLLQTTEIKQGMSLAAANKVYTSANKTAFVWIEMELLFFTQGGCVSCLHGCLAASTVTLVPKPFGRRWQRRWTAARR